MLKPNIATKRLEEIESIRSQLQKLAEEYKNDFTEPNALDPVVDRDLKAAVASLDLLKGFTNRRQRRRVNRGSSSGIMLVNKLSLTQPPERAQG